MPPQIGSGSNSILRGLDYYRLFQSIGPGDIFEIDVSTRAIFVGPDSDIDEFRLYYIDALSQSTIQIADISPGVPFLGRLDALLASRYSTGQQGRIVLHPTVALPQTGGLTAEDSIVYYVPPVIDLFCYTAEPRTGIPSGRNPYIHRQAVTTSGGGASWIFLPAYGRRLYDVVVRNLSGSPGTLQVSGLILTPPIKNPQFVGDDGLYNVAISGALPFTTGTRYIAVADEIRPTDTANGFWDYVMIGVATDDPTDPGSTVYPPVSVTVTLLD